MKLSQKRAEAVEQYLIYAKIDDSRINTKGFGEAFHVTSNNTGEGRQLNRREKSLYWIKLYRTQLIYSD